VPPDDHHTFLLWSGGVLRPVAHVPAGALLVADSWLVDEGSVRGYDLHWARFGTCCAQLGIDSGELAAFRAAVTAALPRRGRWFPRVEVIGGTAGRTGGDQLLLRLRPAHAVAHEARVLVAAPGDPRLRPTWKGPDLPLLLRLRAQAIDAGADELLLSDAGGRLVEGALTALLWWEDDTLCTTPDECTLPSVTRMLLVAIARERGVPVRVGSPLPEQLAGRETWLANAAHGICAVTAWDRAGLPAGGATRAPTWRALLDATARQLDDEP
jgi:branched-subunit amino acid aminotransferase/4-amino-4-deoxychorismate lyase